MESLQNDTLITTVIDKYNKKYPEEYPSLWHKANLTLAFNYAIKDNPSEMDVDKLVDLTKEKMTKMNLK